MVLGLIKDTLVSRRAQSNGSSTITDRNYGSLAVR